MKLEVTIGVLAIFAMVSAGNTSKAMAQNNAKKTPVTGEAAKKVSDLPAVTPAEAKKLLDGNGGYVYLDVRTPEEFEAGRPKGAINVPVLFVDRATHKKVMNEDFLAVVEAHVPKDAKVIVGCRSGSRSAMAQKLMHEAGYEHTLNMLGGFSGKEDSSGKVLIEGWSALNYPTEKGAAGASGYDELKSKAKQ